MERAGKRRLYRSLVGPRWGECQSPATAQLAWRLTPNHARRRERLHLDTGWDHHRDGNPTVENRFYDGEALGAIVHFNHNSIWIQEMFNKIVTVPWYTTASIGYTRSW